MTDFVQKIQKLSLEELIDLAHQKFPLAFEKVSIGQESLELGQIADLEAYIDQLAGREEKIVLPFWAKIWPASILLSYFLDKYLKVDGQKTVLEIGSGLGICGLFLAKKGMNVIISDIEPDALLFIQINILKNGLENKARVAMVDFTKTKLTVPADYIIGSEVLYLKESYNNLVEFLKSNLKPNHVSRIFLAQSYTRQPGDFFALAQKYFDHQVKTIGFKAKDDSGEKFLANIHQLRLKRV